MGPNLLLPGNRVQTSETLAPSALSALKIFSPVLLSRPGSNLSRLPSAITCKPYTLLPLRRATLPYLMSDTCVRAYCRVLQLRLRKSSHRILETVSVYRSQ